LALSPSWFVLHVVVVVVNVVIPFLVLPSRVLLVLLLFLLLFSLLLRRVLFRLVLRLVLRRRLRPPTTQDSKTLAVHELVDSRI